MTASRRLKLDRALRPLLTASVAAVVACSDRTTGTEPMLLAEALPAPTRSTVAMLQCDADVAQKKVACEPVSPSPARSKGASYDLRVLGGQGLYVRLTSSAVTYNAGTGSFAFNTTVQNLTTSALATSDGIARHDEGVRVFFIGPVSATGGTVTVANPTGQSTFTASNQDYFQYGGKISGVDQTDLGADGVLSTSEVSGAKNWQLNVPASVTNFSFFLYVSTETAPGTIASAAPQVASVSPATLVPGTTATVTGTNFNATPGSNTVTIGGAAATVTGGNATSLTVTVPCVLSGSVPVQVTTGGMKGPTYNQPLQTTQRTVAIGDALVLTSSAESFCNELPATGVASRYIVSVFSNSTSPSSNAPMQFSADATGEAAAPDPQGQTLAANLVPFAASRLSPSARAEQSRLQLADARHEKLLEQNAEMYKVLRAQFAGRPATTRRASRSRDVVNADPAPTRQFRVSNISPPAGQTICSSFYAVNATRVYFNGKLAIYEDDATPAGLRSSDNPSMATYYQKIGDQFNADMEPIVRTNFGDILRRDAVTDNNGIEIALFTPRINNSFSGVAGFVVTCDQFANDDTLSTPYAAGGPYTGTKPGAGGATAPATNAASNFGEYFYAYQPTINGTGFGTVGTPDYWYRTIRSTFIHESKHIASQAARVANNAPYEASWLEEGTARHAEELWMRNAVDNVAFKANTGYGTAGNPINVYCDNRPTGFAECDANVRRPASIMQRHFTSLYTQMFGTNARLLSPFGATPSDNASYFYAISWSLVRYATDRYGASDAAFLSGLTNSSSTGATNLAEQAGVSIDQLLGGWALSLAADDHPQLAGPASNDIKFQTWNFRNIYAGLNTDFPGTYTLAYPLVPTQLGFGSFTPAVITTLRGGGALWYELSGTQTAAQLLRLQTNTGGLPSSTLRIAVTRIQ